MSVAFPAHLLQFREQGAPGQGEQKPLRIHRVFSELGVHRKEALSLSSASGKTTEFWRLWSLPAFLYCVNLKSKP